MSRGQQQRQHIAQEAARIMAEEGVSDFYTAKRKAVARLGIGDQHHMPKNSEVEAARAEYQRLFFGAEQIERLRHLRQTALEAMEFLKDFQPKLVGSVLSGSASLHSDVNLHLYTDCLEDVDHFLMDHNIPFQRGQRKIRLNKDEAAQFPSYLFVAGDVELELVVFPFNAMRQAPRSPVDGRAIKRADIQQLKNIMEQEEV